MIRQRRSEAFQDIAAADWRMKKIADAKRFFEQSRQNAESTADPYRKCVRLRKLAVAEFEIGDGEDASTAIELAVAAGRKIEIGGGTDVIALTETATTQRTIGDRDGAAATFEIAIATANRYPEESYVAELLKGVASAQAGEAMSKQRFSQLGGRNPRLPFPHAPGCGQRDRLSTGHNSLNLGSDCKSKGDRSNFIHRVRNQVCGGRVSEWKADRSIFDYMDLSPF